MSWTFEKIFNLSLSSPKEIAFDGRHVWVTGNNQVYVVKYWDYATTEEDYDKLGFANIDNLTIDRYNSKLAIVATISIPQGSHWIVRGGNSMWIASAADFTKITQVDIDSQTVVGTYLTTPNSVVMDSNLCYENGKLWMVDTAPLTNTAPDRQNLHFYDIESSVWSSVEIQTRKSLQKTWIAAPHNGFVYVTNYNDVGVTKFNSITGAWVSQIRVNRLPTALAVTEERDLFVVGAGNLLSRVDPSSDAVTNPYGLISSVNSIASSHDAAYLWWVNTNYRLVRMKKSDQSVYCTVPAIGDEVDDVRISTTGFGDTAVTDVFITPQFTYDNWDGAGWSTVTIKPYMFMIGSGHLMAFRMDNPLYLTLNKIEVNSQGMISTGPEDYMGETG